MAAQQLAEICGITAGEAQALLAETGQDLEQSVALFFAGGMARHRAAPQSPRCVCRGDEIVQLASGGHCCAPPHRSADQPVPPPLSPDAPLPCRTELRSVLGGEITPQHAAQLLQRAGGSVAAAADLYFDQPSAAGPPGGAGGSSGAAAGRGRGPRCNEPITISDSGDTTEDRWSGWPGAARRRVLAATEPVAFWHHCPAWHLPVPQTLPTTAIPPAAATTTMMSRRRRRNRGQPGAACRRRARPAPRASWRKPQAAGAAWCAARSGRAAAGGRRLGTC